MLFNSLAYLVFFPIVTTLYFLIPQRFRTFALLVASSLFYMAFVPSYILILAGTICVDFIAARLIEKLTGRRRKFALGLSIAANVSVLAFFKYYTFLGNNIGTLGTLLHANVLVPRLAILLPIGLSFHTFQAMSYTIEVYRGRQKAETSFFTFALYVMFYPQLVAGPIERPQNLLRQFSERHQFDYTEAVAGLQRMAIGMFKKVVIADTLAKQVDLVYDAPAGITGLRLVLATVMFSFQIYYDFSGYTDIALGSAQVMGFRLMENFRTPYFSQSVGEFWRRWHISLSTWFKDYVYLPLGGNRVAPIRRSRNLMIVFLISGLWHGASWTFVAWGALHGLYVVIGMATSGLRQRIYQLVGIPQRIRKFAATLTTFSLVSVAWIFFRAANFVDAYYVVTHLFSGFGSDVASVLRGSPIPGLYRSTLLINSLLVASATAIEYLTIERCGTREVTIFRQTATPLRFAMYLFSVYACVFVGASGGRQQFIYFQF